MSGRGALRMALGCVLLARPLEVAHLVDARPDRVVLTTMRLLGGRYLVQGAADLAVVHDQRIDAAVEVLHAGSMLLLARRTPSHARLALLSAGVALTLAGVDLAGHLRAQRSRGASAPPHPVVFPDEPMASSTTLQ